MRRRPRAEVMIKVNVKVSECPRRTADDLACRHTVLASVCELGFSAYELSASKYELRSLENGTVCSCVEYPSLIIRSLYVSCVWTD